MNFGHLKSKIEQHLLESYSNGKLKNEMKKFKSVVLENKKVSKLFHLYNELNENKNLSEPVAREFINECISISNGIKIGKSDLKPIEDWVGNVRIGNSYEHIDILLTKDILQLENKIFVKQSILQNLMAKKEIVENKVNLPLSTMVNIANKTFSNYVETLDESERKELMGVLTIPENEMKSDFVKVQEDTIQKLDSLLVSESNQEVKDRIVETIEKVKNENVDRVSYFRLKKLNETL